MKIKLVDAGFPFGKWLLTIIMRAFFIFCCTTVFALTPVNLISQNSKIKIEEAKTLTVDKVFDLIMEQTDYKFFYEEGIFDGYPKVFLEKGVVKTKKLLNKILSQGNTTVTVNGNNAILIQNNSFRSGITNHQGLEITGTITDNNGVPLSGANIIEKGTTNGVIADFDGNFKINITNENAVLVISFVGFVTKEVEVNGRTELKIEMKMDAAGLDAVVVTGVVGATKSKKLPFSVGRISSKNIELVPSPNAGGALRGKLAGVTVSQGSGNPGATPDIILRGVTNIFEGNNSPLYIVDGVILAGGLSDIDALDIENIEVVKGAAASSLYGSRAANGVVNITTKRGKNILEGKLQVTLRNEIGFNQLPSTPKANYSHAYQLSGDPEKPWIDKESGTPTASRLNRKPVADASVAFMDQPYPMQTYDHLKKFFGSGEYYSNYISVAQRTGKLNYRASFNNTHNSGVMKESEGYNRRNVRLNLDAKLTDDLTMAVSGYYSKSKNDEFLTRNENSPFYSLLIHGPEVDLGLRDDEGKYLFNADPLTPYNNPLYDVAYIDNITWQNRFMGSASLNFKATDWLELSGNFSYDNTGSNTERYAPIWYQHARNDDLDGSLSLSESRSESINSSVMATFKKEFGDLSTITQVRALQEHTSFTGSQLTGRGFQVSGVRTIDATDFSRRSGSSSSNEIKSLGYFLITNLDYKDRYIFDAVVRRDGSSLFGEDERWHTYYRVSGAYRLSEEPWFNVNAINDLKFRVSKGTAGGRPNFAAQYETWSIQESIVTKNTLGNKNLKPELASEIELGLDVFLFNKLGLNLTYAKSEVKDQILQLPLVSPYGFNNQWVNGGAVKSNTLEATLDYFAIQKSNLSLSFKLLLDRTRSEITEFNRPTILRNDLFYLREGEEVSTMYAPKWIESYEELATTYGEGYREYFDRNDEGYLVPVGEGNTWRSGLWGEEVIANDGTILGKWGMPSLFVNENGETRVSHGRAMPDFNMGFSTNFRYKGFTAYVLFDGQFDGQVYNRTWQRRVRENLDAINDQGGKPQNEKKPIAYYQKMISDYHGRWIDDASFVKLRELSIGYNFGKENLRPVFGNVFESINISLIGRNLVTWSNYNGIDPEVGDQVYRKDRYEYPNFRQFSTSVEIQF